MTKALIIGGGLAGTTTAIALCKAGIDATVYEAYPVDGDDAGAFLTIMNNGIDALRAVDAHQGIDAVSFPATTVEFLDRRGQLLASQPISGGEIGPTRPRTLKHSALYRVLQQEAVGRGIEIRRGKRLIGARTTAEGGVAARFEDGTEAEGDLLVGADGVHSVVRKSIDPAAPLPRYTGLNILYGYTYDPTLPPSAGAYRMIHGKRAFFGYTGSPDGETYWFARLPGPELTRAQIVGTTTDQWRRKAVEFFIGDVTTPVRIIEATWDRIIGGNVYDMPSTPNWYAGSMVLVGDAAHASSPASGQGASMALEDGVVLAKCLRDLPVDEAFGTYVRIRRQRVERLVANSANDGVAQADGDKVLAEYLNDPQRSRAWLYTHHVDWDEPILP